MEFIMDPSLVLYLPLYELDGASFRSKDAYGHLCTPNGAVWRPNGYYFEGNVRIAVPAISVEGNFTILTWIEIIDNGRHSICGDGNSTYGFILLRDLTKTISFEPSSVDSKGGTVAYTNSIMGKGFILLAMVMDTPTQRAYMDDAFVGSIDPTDGITDLVIAYVGRGYTGTGGSYFGGTMGEFLLYNRALSPQEIHQYYHATKWRYK